MKISMQDTESDPGGAHAAAQRTAAARAPNRVEAAASAWQDSVDASPHVQAQRRSIAQLFSEAPTASTPGRGVAQLGRKKEAATLLQSLVRRKAVQDQVRVHWEGEGIVGVRIHNPPDHVPRVGPEGSPLARIQDELDTTTTYNHLRVFGGASAGGVFGTPDPNGRPATVADVVSQSNLPPDTAVINGGYFAHNDKMLDDSWEKAGIGRPVGPTAGRDDSLPIPEEYASDYGHLTVDGDTGLSSGPLLAHDGQVGTDDFSHDRFKYRVMQEAEDGSGNQQLEENWRNDKAGVLTHASDRNARAALSIVQGDVFMQTLSPDRPEPGRGATMAQWRKIATAGARVGPQNGGSTLNLDGGGSVFMGVTEEDGKVREVARGGATNLDPRPVANIVASHSPDLGQ